jgi:two-component sensor histidine kinase
VKVSNGYFLAVYGKGLIQVDSEFRFIKTISFAQGLINTGIYKIYNYRDSVLITGSNNGLFVYDINSGKVRRFTVQDGLHSNNFDETSGSALNGIIYLGGIGGFTRIIPSQLMSDTLKPTCFFSDIEIKMPHGEIDTLNTHCEKLIVAKDYRQVTINFASPYFSNYESILYMYKMGYSNEEWITAGRQNSITITGIKPGNYTLYVKAVNSDGIQSDVIKLDLYFQPKWYQTWWFQSLLFLLFAVIVYRIYKYRIRQIRKEERLRQRIAGDLHDDIGSTLNSIKVYANLALSQPQQHEHLINVKQNTQEAISGLRDVIWVLDDREDTIEQLSIRISQFAKPLCAANHITFTADINPDLYGTKLGKEQKRNIYLTLKESINNSIKYSESSKIDFIIERNGQQINFIIKDNGKGFDTTKPSHGNGLKNIYSRAKQAKYKAFIESAPGQGTTITLTN